MYRNQNQANLINSKGNDKKNYLSDKSIANQAPPSLEKYLLNELLNI